MNQVCRSKYAQELAEQEYHLLKQQITYYNTPSQSFDFSPIAHSLLNDFSSIQDEQIQQEYYQKCEALTENCRADLFTMHMKAIEDDREEYKNKYEAYVSEMWSSKHSFNNEKEKQFSPIMIQLIGQRCQEISERIKCIYKFKAQSFP